MVDLVVGLDGDDTLWHNETIFRSVQEWYSALLAGYGVATDRAASTLHATERRNLELYGYGIKGFSLSLIETAIELTDGAITGADLGQVMEQARWMLSHPTHLIDGVADTVAELAQSHRLLLITKGDLLDQESKVARSGLAEHFTDVHIVSEKDPDTYQRILARHAIQPDQFVMVGNSVRSDVLPVVELGASAVHIEYHVTWEAEHVADASPDDHGYTELATITALPAHLAAR